MTEKIEPGRYEIGGHKTYCCNFDGAVHVQYDDGGFTVCRPEVFQRLRAKKLDAVNHPTVRETP